MVSQVTSVDTDRTCDRLAYHYLAAVDIEGFSSLSALEQVQMQADLDRVLDTAANRACLNRELWQLEMRGDGELAVLPAETDGPAMIADYPRELAGALAELNRGRQLRLRLRVAMHHGTVVRGCFGPVGQGPIVVSRLLDSAELHSYLAEHTRLDLALIVSESLYHDVIETRFRGLEPAEFAHAHISAKGVSYPAYIHHVGGPIQMTCQDTGQRQDALSPIFTPISPATTGHHSPEAIGPDRNRLNWLHLVPARRGHRGLKWPSLRRGSAVAAPTTAGS
jgi:class 3 adenylate cyclase